MRKVKRSNSAVIEEAPFDNSEKTSVWKIIAELVGWTITAAGVIMFIFLVALPMALGGARATTVVTESMKPGINAGDLVMIKPATMNDLRLNDIAQIQIESGKDTTYIHRVTGIAVGGQDGKIITTQGDANPKPDAPVKRKEQVHGVVINMPFTDHPYVIPKLGYLKERPLLTLGIAAVLILLALISFGSGDKKKKRVEDEKRKKDQAELEELRRFKAEKAASESTASATPVTENSSEHSSETLSEVSETEGKPDPSL